MKIYNSTRNLWVGEAKVADSFFSRLKGLMFSKASERGLWLKGCNSIHTFWMRHSLDVVFLDKERRVVKQVQNVKPSQPYISCNRGESVLEFFTGKWNPSSVQVGDQLEFKNELSA